MLNQCSKFHIIDHLLTTKLYLNVGIEAYFVIKFKFLFLYKDDVYVIYLIH